MRAINPENAADLAALWRTDVLQLTGCQFRHLARRDSSYRTVLIDRQGRYTTASKVAYRLRVRLQSSYFEPPTVIQLTDQPTRTLEFDD